MAQYDNSVMLPERSPGAVPLAEVPETTPGLGEGLVMPSEDGRMSLSDSGRELHEERSKLPWVKSPTVAAHINVKRSSAPEAIRRLAWEPEAAESRGGRFRSEGDEKKGLFGRRRLCFGTDSGILPESTSESASERRTSLSSGARHLLRVSRKTQRQLVPTEKQVSELFTSDEVAEDSGSIFAGPLGQLYPNGRIRRRRRHDEDEWHKCMQVNKSWGASAENSGLSTFWQAILIAGLKVHQAVDSLKTICDRGKLKLWMVENAALALGKLTNTIGLSWVWDHDKNVEQLSETASRSINIKGLQHRYDTGSKKVWRVLEKLEHVQERLSNRRQCTPEKLCNDLSAISKLYEEFYIYLVGTAQIVLEDCLLCYRQNLHDGNISCVASALKMSNRTDGVIESAVAIIAGATPPKQRLTRFKAMGFQGLSARSTTILGNITYKRTFAWPLNEVISAGLQLDKKQGNAAKQMDGKELGHRYFRRVSSIEHGQQMQSRRRVSA